MEKRALWLLIGLIGGAALALKHLLCPAPADNQAKTIAFFRVDPNTGEKQKMEKIIFKADDQEPIVLEVEAFDAAGNPAPVDGAFQFEATGPVQLTPSEDGKRLSVRQQGPVGTGIVSAIGDADLGVGVKQIIGQISYEVFPGEAVRLGLRVVPPTPPPPPPVDEQPVQ